MSKKILKKIVSLVLSFTILFQSFAPILALPVYANEIDSAPIEEITPTPEPEVSPTPTETITPTVTPETTPTPTIEVTPEITPTPTEEITPSPTPEITPESTPSGTPITPEITPEVTPTLETSPAPTPETQPSSQNPDQPSSPSPDSQQSSSDDNAVIPQAPSPLSEAITIVAQLEQGIAPLSNPTITSDKADYFPTDIAYLSGTGFIPGATYNLHISSSDIPTVSYNASVTADENGNIAYAYQLDGNYRPNYFVEAIDASGVIVTTYAFTDSRNVLSIQVNGTNSVTVTPNTSVNVSVTVNTNGILLANDWRSTRLSLDNGASWLPCVDTSDYTSSGNHTESFNINAPSSGGTYDLTVRAYQFDFCLGDDDEDTLNNAITVDDSHIITATAGTGGVISPSGSVDIDDGDDQTFTSTPNSTYIVSDVLVDSVSVGRLNSYTFNNVSADHTIATSFDGGWYSADDFSNDDFSNAGTISVSNNSYSTSNSSGESETLREFDIPSIPAGSTINGIEVAVEGHTSGRNVIVSLSKNGGSSFGSTTYTTSFSSTDKTIVLGGNTNLWGQTWTNSSFTNGNFRLKVTSTSGGGIVSLDQIQVKVSYTEAPSDTTAPDLTVVTPVTTPTNDSTPNYTFNTNEAGTITYGVDCSSSTTAAVIGNNTITFNSLSDGTHSNCTITVTDSSNNASSPLNVSSFVVDTIAPTANIDYSTTAPTNGDVTATLDPSESVTVTNNSGSMTYLFTSNDSFTFEFIDAAGNTGSALATVTNIDKENPTTPVATPGQVDYLYDPDVTLTSSDNNGVYQIYYTNDGTDPDTSLTRILYNNVAFTIGQDMVIKAIAYDNVGNASGILEAVYGIAPHISGENATSVDTTFATISWITDDLSTSRVVYDTVSHPVKGSAPNYGYTNSTVETDNSPKVVNHSVLLTGLTPSTTYYYRVISHGSPEAVGEEKSFNTASVGGSGVSDGNSPASSAPFCSATKPGTPVLLSAVAGFNSVTLTWSKAADPVSYYLITYGTSSGSQQYGNPNVGGSTTTSYTVNGLSGGVTYYFQIRAGNECAPGSYSNEVSATPIGGVVAEPASGFAPGVLGTTTDNKENVSTDSATVSPTPSILGDSTDDKNNWNWWWLLLLIPGYIAYRRLFKKK